MNTRTKILFSCFFLALLFGSCYRCDKSKKQVRITRLKGMNSLYIPALFGSMDFVSDSGVTMKFDEVTTTHEFKEVQNCQCIECCCSDYVNYEITRQVYWNHKDNFTFQMVLNSDDVYDGMLFTMSRSSSDPCNYGDVEYIRNDSISDAFNDSIPNRLFLDNLDFRGKAYKNVYQISVPDLYANTRKYAETVYYTQSNGIIGFILNDKSKWGR